MNIGNQIKLARIRKGMTISELAGEDYTKSHISKIENNKTNPSYETLQKISHKLGVQVSEFFDEVDHEWTKATIEEVNNCLEKLIIPEDIFEEIFLNINKLTFTKDTIKLLYLMINHYTLNNDVTKVNVIQDKIDYIIFYIDDEKVTLECKILSGNLFFSERKYNDAFTFFENIKNSLSFQLKKYPDLNQLYLLQYLVAIINIDKEEEFSGVFKEIYYGSLKTENFSAFTRATIILLSYYKLTSNERKINEYNKELYDINRFIPKSEYQVEIKLSYGTEPFRNQTLRNLERYKEVASILETESDTNVYLDFINLELDFINKDYKNVIDSFSKFTIPKEFMYCVIDRVSLFQRSLILPFSYLAIGEEDKAKIAFNVLFEEVKDIQSHSILEELLVECSIFKSN